MKEIRIIINADNLKAKLILENINKSAEAIIILEDAIKLLKEIEKDI